MVIGKLGFLLGLLLIFDRISLVFLLVARLVDIVGDRVRNVDQFRINKLGQMNFDSIL
jgi:hypothetical protein